MSSFPVQDLLRTLDAMSWVKINTFHWHVTDSQSFPLEVAEYPQLAANGAYSSDETYSASDVQNIVQYANAVRFFLSRAIPLLISRTSVIARYRRPLGTCGRILGAGLQLTCNIGNRHPRPHRQHL